MQKALLIGLALSAASLTAFAQATEVYTMVLPQNKVSNSLYNKFTVLDARPDTSNLGIVQLGAFNRKAKVITKVPMRAQLTDVFKGLTNGNGGDKEMLLQLRQFSFAEITGAMSETGYFYMRAALYAKTSDNYQQIKMIDTMVIVNAMDVTNKIMKAGSQTMTGFIEKGLQQQPAGNTISYADILRIDELEKQQLKLYTAGSFTDGLYTNYRSFADQVPDKPITVEMSGEDIKAVKVMDEAGKPKKVKSKGIYAFVHKGVPYVATRNQYCRLKKVENDLIFTGEAAVTADTGDVMLASAFFGILGGLMASNASAMFEMKIDHVNGGFIKLREIPAANKTDDMYY